MSDVITENLDLWTSALLTKSTAGRGSNGRLEAYGIKKLRELILELAVRGKLVRQDSNAEPASVLLQKIAKQKASLVKEGKIKKDKPLPNMAVYEISFVLPVGWAQVKLDAISEKITDGEHLSPQKTDFGMKLLTAKHVLDDGITLEDPQYVSQDDGIRFRERCAPQTGDVLICSRGTIGRCCAIEVDEEFCLMGSVILVRAFEQIVPRYLAYYLKSESGQFFIRGATKGMAVNALYLKDIKLCPVAVPPLAEQHHIVAKVDELMALCDQLEQQQTNNIEAHQTLVETLLGTLTNIESQQELNEAWTRIADHFDTLFTTEQSIDQLKQTILQLAVMGKLVPQDPNDEPASELMERISRAKAKLVDEGVIRKQEPQPEIQNSENPFDPPSGWSFARLGDLSKLITKGSSPKWQGVSYTDDPNDILFVTSENVGSYTLLLESKKYVEKKFNDVEPRSILQKNDFLMNIVGASIGRTAIYDIEEIANINQAVCLIRVFFEFLDSKYLLHFFNSVLCVSYMFDKQVENARANLSMGNIAKFIIPLPPLAEQCRIVAKVDELMALCDALKARLSDVQTTQIYLADAIVEQAVA